MKRYIVRLIGIFLFLFIISKIDWTHFLSILSSSDYLLVFLSFISTIPVFLFKSLRWRTLISWQGFRLGFLESFLFYLCGFFLGVITIGRIGEFSKAVYLRDSGFDSAVRALSNVLYDRMLDVVLLVFLATLAVFYISPWALSTKAAVAGILLISLLILLYLHFGDIGAMILNSMRRLAVRMLPANAVSSIGAFQEGLGQLMGRNLFSPVLLTVFSYGFFFFSCWLAARSVGLEIGYFNVVLVMSISNLISMLPITVGGLGTRESVFILFLSPLGIPVERILAFSITVFLVTYVGDGLLGMSAWFIRPLKLDTV